MKITIAATVAVVLSAFAATGCATIVAKSSQTVTVTSEPPGAAVSIINRAGTAVHSGNTPMTVTLRKGAGYFKPERYQVRVSKEGFRSHEAQLSGSVNAWYAGNILIGGLIGMLAVDPATGAMYTLQPKAIDAKLEVTELAAEIVAADSAVIDTALSPAKLPVQSKQ